MCGETQNRFADCEKPPQLQLPQLLLLTKNEQGRPAIYAPNLNYQYSSAAIVSFRCVWRMWGWSERALNVTKVHRMRVRANWDVITFENARPRKHTCARDRPHTETHMVTTCVCVCVCSAGARNLRGRAFCRREQHARACMCVCLFVLSASARLVNNKQKCAALRMRGIQHTTRSTLYEWQHMCRVAGGANCANA